MKSKKYQITRDNELDFLGEAYATTYPNLHRYPATMLPQLGITLLNRLNISKGLMLDPYCGSGSSFASGLHVGMRKFIGFDLNPLAVLITKVKFTKLDCGLLKTTQERVTTEVNQLKLKKIDLSEIPKITNMDFWFPKSGLMNLVAIKKIVEKIEDENIRNLFYLAFSETIRDVSYTRNSEFKLYRIQAENLDKHKHDAPKQFLSYLEKICSIYLTKYHPQLDGVETSIKNDAFEILDTKADVVLTSPPYGDSRTTVAYGQFSTFTNEWFGFEDARKVDSRLMGGKRAKEILENSLIQMEIEKIAGIDAKRSLEVSSFYEDLRFSIQKVSEAVKKGGHVIYVVGNRRVKDVQLSTDQFIAEEFERGGCKHIATYERLISSKTMPSSNSPSNKSGAVRGTMTQEFVVICEKS